MQPRVSEHFSSNDHNGFLEDCSITLTDKAVRSDPTRRQEYWKRILKTFIHYGLNSRGRLSYLGKSHR